ncbi:hypothetical protein [Streptomyces sparsogenes]|nr:hypothetical protein [Streptomyces sparsogenes]
MKQAIMKPAAALLTATAVFLVTAICIPSAPPRAAQAAVVHNSII